MGTEPERASVASRVADSAALARLRHPSRRLTTRAAILAAVICALVLSLAYPLKQYLAQRSSIIQLRQDNAARADEVAKLKERQRQLTDPDYIKAQARQRLQYVMPGETPFVVVHQGDHPNQTTQPKDGRVDRTSPWYDQLWQSVQKADRTP
ncbi:MAG TPA: septum formation initiator family protein [Mycobacteriales bacterium]|nr:septum formation initiator family protein [Mycobacteriales bacterium]